MKHIYLNLKRFDIPRKMGGVNSIAPIGEWAGYIVKNTQDAMESYGEGDVEFVTYFPEAHLIGAIAAKNDDSPFKVGSQSLFWEDTSVGGNFGAFTSSRTANSLLSVGCTHTIIGHCEERRRLSETLKIAGVSSTSSVNKILNLKVKAAVQADLSVLYCIGESEAEHDKWQEVLAQQLDVGLDGVDKKDIVVAYEPIWSIGPGKKPAGKEHIADTARFIKQITPDAKVVYGGGLKEDNAEMLSSIKEIDGGLIALTRFTGDVGFYPDEYLKIVELYLNGAGIEAKG